MTLATPNRRPYGSVRPYACKLSRLVAHQFKIMREAQGLSQEQFAAPVGLTGAAIMMYETGRRNMPLPVVEAACTVLGADGYRLLFPGACLACGGTPGYQRMCTVCGARG